MRDEQYVMTSRMRRSAKQEIRSNGLSARATNGANEDAAPVQQQYYARSLTRSGGTLCARDSARSGAHVERALDPGLEEAVQVEQPQHILVVVAAFQVLRGRAIAPDA